MAGAGPGSAVEPFRFEPQTDSSGDSDPEPGDDNVWDGVDVETERWRLGNRDWCRCGNDDNRNCLEMPSVRESVCCHDLPELTDTDKNLQLTRPFDGFIYIDRPYAQRKGIKLHGARRACFAALFVPFTYPQFLARRTTSGLAPANPVTIEWGGLATKWVKAACNRSHNHTKRREEDVV
ncbi:hypothetical protein Bbelb_078750 [Branchiostoma belcheri]|nr:hypothetical protein Bbelb_078750 [Branchiostoma belcheri]